MSEVYYRTKVFGTIFNTYNGEVHIRFAYKTLTCFNINIYYYVYIILFQDDPLIVIKDEVNDEIPREDVEAYTNNDEDYEDNEEDNSWNSDEEFQTESEDDEVSS